MLHIKSYPSVAALARDAAAVRPFHLSLVRDSAYFNHESADDAVRLAQRGDTALVPEAERLLSQINAALDVPERPMVADVAGAYPVVAEYLAGMPDCMRRRAIVENDAVPVRLYYCVTASMVLSAETLMRRGCAALALVMALARVRPVELILFNATKDGDSGDESVITAPVNTAPLDIATAAYTLSSAGFARRLCYNLARHHHFGRRKAGLAYFETAMPELLRRLGGDPARDVILPPARSEDALIADPVAWVNAQLAKFREAAQ